VKKIWRALFPPKASTLLNKVDFGSVTQTSIGVNTHTYGEFLPNVRVELSTGTLTTLAYGLKGREGRWDIWETGAWAAGRSVPFKEKTFAPLWLFTHLSLNESFRALKAQALTPVTGLTAATLQNESRALQWLQATFKVLEGALQRCREDKENLVVATFWVGLRDGRQVLRISCFNLDMTAAFRESGVLHMLVFDDKGAEPGSAKTPSLEVEFGMLKTSVMDELIKISAAILGAAESRYRD
jgi:hypothetical protein